jgi:hypothetical protein
VLHQQNGFDWRFPMSIQELIDEFLFERARIDFRNIAFPPIGFVSAVMKPDTTKLAGICKDKRAFALKKDEMVVLGWSIICRFDPDLSGHAEMNAEPVVPGKFEEHAFAARMRAEKFFAN